MHPPPAPTAHNPGIGQDKFDAVLFVRFASTCYIPPMQKPPQIFDPIARAQRHRRATADAMFLQSLARDEILSRREDVNRSFTNVGIVTPYPDIWSDVSATIIAPTDVLDVQEGQFDLVIHALCLHQFDDPLGQIIQCRRALKPDGLFLAAMFGGETLAALRDALTRAELQVTQGAGPRISPMIEIRDSGALLQRAGLTLPVSDVQPQVVSYKSIYHLMRDLRTMGEANILQHRSKKPLRRSVFEVADSMYPKETDDRIMAEFDILYLTGWSPHESQQKPLRPGSAQVSLIDALNPGNSDPDN